MKSNALKADTRRYYPARRSHPWVSFVLVLRARPALEARAPWHRATRCSMGGDLFEELSLRQHGHSRAKKKKSPRQSQTPAFPPLSTSLHFLLGRFPDESNFTPKKNAKRRNLTTLFIRDQMCHFGVLCDEFQMAVRNFDDVFFFGGTFNKCRGA